MGKEKPLLNEPHAFPRRKLLIAGGGVATAWMASRLFPHRAELTSSALDTAEITEPIPPFLAGEEALRLRETYRNAALWHPRTLVLFSDDMHPNGTPRFLTAEATRAVRKKSPGAEFITALRTSTSGRRFFSSQETIMEAKLSLLEAIRTSGAEPISLVLSAHGGPSGIEVGSYTEGKNERHSIYITPDELGDAFAVKYRSMRARLTARQIQDMTSFVNCSSGTLAGEFMTGLTRAEIEQEQEHLLWAFKPTIPVAFSASTGSETAYINTLLFKMTECDTVGDMYRYAERIERNNAHSNPAIRVPDPESGEPVIIG